MRTELYNVQCKNKNVPSLQCMCKISQEDDRKQ